MKLHLTLLLSFFLTMSLNGQNYLETNGSFMYTGIELHHSQKGFQTRALIDTGTSLSVVDSTYAVDTLLISPTAFKTIVVNGDVQTYRTEIDTLNFCGQIYTGVHCLVINLIKRYHQYAPSFIVGADILRREAWKFNTKEHTIEKAGVAHQKGKILKWKDHQDLPKANWLSINLEAKVNGKKVLFLFDTGARMSHLPISCGLQATKRIQREAASLNKSLTLEETDVYEGVLLNLQKQSYLVDFLATPSDIGLLNIEFLQGKAFILNYQKKRIVILE